MNTGFLLLGGNLGNREKMLKDASALLERDTGAIINSSSVYETAAWGVTGQPDFLNQVLVVETALTCRQLLHKVQQIELLLGRKRCEKWHARTIDIDILYFNEEVIDQPDLKVPHPEMHRRNFTLHPLAEVAPFFVHPLLQQNSLQLLKTSPDGLPVSRLTDVVVQQRLEQSA